MAIQSCSKDILLDVNRGAAIEFTVAAQTRAQELTSNNLLTFYVTAVDLRQNINYFSEAPYMKSGEYYVSSPTYYWPGDESPLNIYAFAPSVVDLGVTDSGNGQTELKIDRSEQILKNFSPADDISQQQDFITAVLPEYVNPGDGIPVSLPFKHQLVQIEVKAKNGNENEVYHIKGVKIAQVKSKGDFNFSNEKWTLDNEAKAIYEVTYDNARILDPYGVSLMASQDDNAMLLPQVLTPWDPQDDQVNADKGAYISVLMKITPSSGSSVDPADADDDYMWVAAPFPNGTEWVAGNKYIYTLDFSNGASYSDPATPGGGVLLQNEIDFDVDIVPWNESSSSYHPLIGTWNIYNAIVTIQVEGNEPNVLEMPSRGAIIQMDVISEAATTIRFESHNMYYMYGIPNPYYTSYVDGQLYIIADDAESIQIESYSERNMKLYAYEVENIESSDGEQTNVTLEFELNYTKEGYSRTDLRDWEIYLPGEWSVYSSKRIRTASDGTVLSECILDSFEEILQKKDEVEEAFYVLTFPSAYEWHFNGDSTNYYTMIVDGKLSLFAEEIDYHFFSWYNIEVESETQMKVYSLYENDEAGTTEYMELNYRKL